MSFGKAIKQLREAQNMRPELLAVHCECSITAIYDWEGRDSTPVHLARFKRLADTLGITLDELASFGAVPDHEEAAA